MFYLLFLVQGEVVLSPSDAGWLLFLDLFMYYMMMMYVLRFCLPTKKKMRKRSFVSSSSDKDQDLRRNALLGRQKF